MPRLARTRGWSLIAAPWLIFAATLTGCTSGVGELWLLPRWGTERSVVPAVDLDAVSLSSRFSAPLAITPANTQISFVGSTKNASHTGEFKRFTGSLDLPDGDPNRAKLAVEVDVASLYSRTVMLAWYLKSKNAFDVATYSSASFRSTSVKATPDAKTSHFVTGEFSIHGRTRSVGFPANFSIAADSVDFTAEITLKQSDFGLDRLASKTIDEVPLTVVSRLPRNDGLFAQAGDSALRSDAAEPQ